MKRMRKSKPTMAIYASVAGSKHLYVKPGEAWPQLKPRAGFANIDRLAGPTLAPSYEALVPLGNCPNVPSPCGHCWYCEQRKQAVAK